MTDRPLIYFHGLHDPENVFRVGSGIRRLIPTCWPCRICMALLYCTYNIAQQIFTRQSIQGITTVVLLQLQLQQPSPATTINTTTNIIQREFQVACPRHMGCTHAAVQIAQCLPLTLQTPTLNSLFSLLYPLKGVPTGTTPKFCRVCITAAGVARLTLRLKERIRRL